jgi:predicted dehydrogenase
MSIPSFALIGAGWRADFFLRIARDLPERFPFVGAVVRDAGKRAQFQAKWPFPAFASLDELLAAANPRFVVTAVGWDANLPLIETLAGRGIAVLSETPIAPDLAGLRSVFALAQAGARIQLAEQYLFQPMQAARLAFVESGRLGTIYEADVSIAHGYHGVSLLRHYLQVGLRLPRITARKFTSRIVQGPGREGPPARSALTDSDRIIAHLDYGDRLGVFDFTGDQYFSWIRSPRLLVRGEKGEINNSAVRVLQDYQTPLRFDFIRRDAGIDGNLEGYHHQAILAGGEIFYKNPFPGPRWSDDEIAVATSLARMQEYVEGGPSFYGMAEACHDRYLDMAIAESIDGNKTIDVEPQPWTSRES